LLQADLAYYPFAERFDVAMPAFCGFNMRSQENRAIRNWLEAMEGREAVMTCAVDAGLLLEAFK
jgi:hypothetical protein